MGWILLEDVLSYTSGFKVVVVPAPQLTALRSYPMNISDQKTKQVLPAFCTFGMVSKYPTKSSHEFPKSDTVAFTVGILPNPAPGFS